MADRHMLRAILVALCMCTAGYCLAAPAGSTADGPTPPRPLAGTEPLTWEGDLADRMVAGIDQFLLRKLAESAQARPATWERVLGTTAEYNRSIEPQRELLTHILGMRDARAPIDALELVTSTAADSLVATGATYDVREIRWQAVGPIHGYGLLLEPKRTPVALVVAVGDADQSPEQLCGLEPGIAEENQFARRLAEAGCRVVVPALVSRGRDQFEWHGRRHGISHREFLYRSAFELGRHILGYETQKILAAIDALQADAERRGQQLPVGVYGYGEGGLLALYAGALDTRIDTTVVSGCFEDRNVIWRQPLERNVFGLLEQFGDAELATMIAPRRLIVEACDHPAYELPPGTGGAPAKLVTPSMEVVRAETKRARRLLDGWRPADDWLTLVGAGAGPPGSQAALEQFLAALDPAVTLPSPAARPHRLRPGADPEQRLWRQMQQMDQHTQDVLRDSADVRREFMKQLDTTSPDAYQQSAKHYRKIFREDVIGQFDDPRLPARPRTRWLRESERVVYYEVVLDVFPDVFAYGILCLPRDLRAGERRPVVVCQHGLEGRPQSVLGEQDYQYYKAFATQLAERGFITFAPQNPYIFQDRFRTLQRKAYPLKKTLFSIIVPQHQQIVDWLQGLPMVDPERVAFYGLSYGGKTAMRVPALVEDYCLSICSADFNEWVDKNASTRNPRSYVWTGEYEIFEWDLGSTFNYAEMAALIAPRPFMVERGHFDGVADDWTVGWEFAKVRHLYQARLKLGQRCAIEWFDGPHAIHGQGTFDFLHTHLNWPAPEHPSSGPR